MPHPRFFFPRIADFFPAVAVAAVVAEAFEPRPLGRMRHSRSGGNGDGSLGCFRDGRNSQATRGRDDDAEALDVRDVDDRRTH